ncbi:MAG: hypothetical protein AAFX94_09345 [Myxococcota bacterium]
MNDPSDHSSDLALAGRLSRKLAGGVARAAVPQEPGDYLSWTAPAARHSGPVPRAPVCETLEELLAWALRVTGQPSAFIVDPQGFVIATAGVTPADYFSGTGAALSYASEHIRNVVPDEPLGSAELAFGTTRILALTGRDSDIRDYVFALVGEPRLDPETTRKLTSELARGLRAVL